MPKKKKLYDLLNDQDRRRVRAYYIRCLELFQLRDGTAIVIDDIAARHDSLLAKAAIEAKISPAEVKEAFNIRTAKILVFSKVYDKALVSFARITDDFRVFDLAARKKIEALPRKKNERVKAEMFSLFKSKAAELRERFTLQHQTFLNIEEKLSAIEKESKQTWN